MGVADLLARLRRAPERSPRGLEERTACCREILHANNTVLGTIARLQEALTAEAPVSDAEVRRLVTAATVQTSRMVVNLTRLTGRRHRAVGRRFDALKRQIVARVEVTPTLEPVGLVVPLAAVEAGHAEALGQKSAFLGEARRLLGAHVPPGFAISADAYRAFMATDELGQRIAAVLAAADLVAWKPDGLRPAGSIAGGYGNPARVPMSADVARCFETCARVTTMIEGARVPPAVAAAITAAVDSLPGSPDLRLAVRSSALMEGGRELSFAGQYRSLLNVPRDRVLEAYKRVVASKYSPEALTYRLGRGCDDAEVAMCCCVLAMVDAVAAGVLYTACDTPAGPRMLLHAVRGLGIAAVDGSAEPDTIVLDPTTRAVLDRRCGRQATLVRSLAGEGTERLPLEGTSTLVLADRQARAVADVGLRLQSALGVPVDLEWAIGRDGGIAVVQVRPQPVHAGLVAPPETRRVPDVPVLLEGGGRASGGAACGPVTPVTSDLDLVRCPPGAVVVSREASPRLAVLLPRAAAVVCDFGEATGHLAVVARELRVPALFAARTATAVLTPGAVVTVDADAAVVYAGRVDALLATPPQAAPRDPGRERLASVAELIVPLTLQHRLASGFSVRRCRTLHDLVRYCHQATIEAMFALGDRAALHDGAARRLVSECPVDCRVIDLGGGLRDGSPPGEVALEDVLCVPMRALFRGMTDPRLSWQTARPLSKRGFASSMMSFGFDEDARVRDLGEPSFAFVTAEYLSLNSRIGYHFATIDARVGADPETRYLSFRFVGGSTGVEQRSRRATLLERLLTHSGFETDRRVDLVNARIRRLPVPAMEEKLSLVGRLLEFVNHLDMALTSDGVLLEYERAFLREDYGYGRSGHA